jgi:hypothetical protein
LLFVLFRYKSFSSVVLQLVQMNQQNILFKCLKNILLSFLHPGAKEGEGSF